MRERARLLIGLALLLGLTSSPARGQDLSWHASLESAKREARRSGKPILVVVLKTGSAASRRLLREFSRSRAIRELLPEFVRAKLDRGRHAEFAKRYSLTISPSTLFLTDRGAPIKALVGPVSAGKYAAQMKAALEKYRDSKNPRFVLPKPMEKNAPPVEPPDPGARPSPRRIDESARAAAVSRALAWLVGRQGRDGRWRRPKEETVTSNEEGKKVTRSIDHIDVALTSMAGLALLAEGSTPEEGRYSQALARAVRFVSGAVRSDGIISDKEGNDWLYLTQANFETPLGAIFLSEAYRIRPERALREKLDRVTAYLVRVQDPRSGAWGYSHDFRDFPTHLRRGWRLLATTHYCLTALNHLKEAGIEVDEEARKRAARYLLACLCPDGSFTYRSEFRRGSGYPGASAGALYALARSGAVEPADLEEAWGRFRSRYRRFDGFGKHWWFFLFQCALTLNHRGPAALADLEDGFVNALIDGQGADGSWEDPDGNGGAVYATAVGAIVLQIGKGRLPISSARADPGPATSVARPRYLKTPHPTSRVKVFLRRGRYWVDLLVTTDGPGDPERMAELERAFLGANRILYDVTNGGMSMHRIVLRANGKGREEADVLIAMDFSRDEETNPHPFAHGITRISQRTEVRGEREKERLAIGDWVRLPYYRPGREEAIRWDDRRFVRVLAHELCHYLFGLKDEYDLRTGRPLCWSILGNLRSTEFCRDENHTHPTLPRSSWSQAKALYEKLEAPEVADPGPWEPPRPEVIVE